MRKRTEMPDSPESMYDLSNPGLSYTGIKDYFAEKESFPVPCHLKG